MSADRTKRLLTVQERMPRHSERALTNFTTTNPNWRGAEWADCLDILDDSDSHLDIVEPLYDVLAPRVTEAERPYIALVAVTLVWADPTEPMRPYNVLAWVKRVSMDSPDVVTTDTPDDGGISSEGGTLSP